MIEDETKEASAAMNADETSKAAEPVQEPKAEDPAPDDAPKAEQAPNEPGEAENEPKSEVEEPEVREGEDQSQNEADTLGLAFSTGQVQEIVDTISHVVEERLQKFVEDHIEPIHEKLEALSNADVGQVAAVVNMALTTSKNAEDVANEVKATITALAGKIRHMV